MALIGKVAVVTGAAMGIGKAMTQKLLTNGAKVAVLDVNEPAGRSLKEDLDKQFGEERTVFLKCDVQSEEQIRASIQETVETFGGLDILCNNAGVLNESQWEKTISVNLAGVIKVTYLALDHMNKQSGGRGGVVVNTASAAGLGPLPGFPTYTATKHGVVGFTRAMALASNISGYGIRFNALCPNFTQTDFIVNTSDKMGQFVHLEFLTQKLLETRGMLTVSQVADCLLELVSDGSKNGEALVVKTTGNFYMKFPAVK